MSKSKMSKADRKKLLKVALVLVGAWFFLTMPGILTGMVGAGAGYWFGTRRAAKKATSSTVTSRAAAAWKAAKTPEVTAAPTRPKLVKS